MIVKNVAILNVQKWTELGDFTWVTIVTAHNMSDVY